jgi:tRNA G10  N-methylase Trm11
MNNQFNYCFALGNNHTLCKVEIINVLCSKGIEFSIIESSKETLIIETDKEIEKDINIDIFGSTAKFVKIYKTISLNVFLENKNSNLIDYDFIDFFIPKNKNKLVFGLTVYGSGCRFKDLNSSWYISPSVCRDFRNELKVHGVKIGFLPLRERILSTVSVDKNKLLTNGFEVVLAIGKETVYIGKTLAVQDYESYSFRDYSRPNRDSRSGMIPPKLAKMMINLSGKDRNKLILDPFCGSGTILGELVLLGYRKIIGSDISNKAVDDSKININWLFDEYNEVNRDKHNVKIMKSDATTISKVIEYKSIDAIVTEPFLGSPKKKFSLNQVNQEIKELEHLYLKTFSEFKKILNHSGIVVIISPIFKCQGEFFNLSILKDIKRFGFKQRNFLPHKYLNPKNLDILNLEITDRNSIIYYRPDQTVSREIFLFEI